MPADDLLARVARRIAELRLAAGLTQEQMAHELGYRSPQTYVRIEQGDENLTLRRLGRIAAVLNVDPAEFFVPPTTPKPGRGRPRASATEPIDIPRRKAVHRKA